MRFKPVFASLLLMGLSVPAFAATTADGQSSSVQSRLNAMQSQINQMQQLINQNNGGTQANGGTTLQSMLGTSPNWFNSISVSGLLNVDAMTSSRSPVLNANRPVGQPMLSSFGHGSSSDLTLSNADLFVDAQVNDWTKAHIGLNYQSDYLNDVEDFNYDKDKSIVIKNVSGSILDEAYVTLGNFTETPFYARVGKQYVNFGNYDRYAAVPTFTQLLTQTNETAATLGFVNQGFFASVYGFRGVKNDNDGSLNLNNFGANVGFANQNCNFGYKLQASYLNNMADVEYVGATNQIFIPASVFELDPGDLAALAPLYSPLSSTGYHAAKVGAMSLDGGFNVGMFDMNAHWVSALRDFDMQNLITTSNNYYYADGARPEAMTVGAGVTFDVVGHTSRFGVDYQRSWQAENVGLYGIPQDRYEGTYNISVSKNVNLGLDVYHDQDYNIANGGSDRSATTGLLRLGVMFA